ncbi:O-methyltransferase [Chaetoceros tenuissimus]|uniref:O-methyltransferase n=1 Tax=Chaetoceros tenuissimus TaxID=426638 RepID=A0AAD3CW09_9STRA|nr:O-methyltransferase [Chaetoceros tenuissimus]
MFLIGLLGGMQYSQYNTMSRSLDTPKSQTKVTVSSSIPSSPSCRPKMAPRPLKNRNELPQLLEDFKFKTGIEIGVQEGKFSKIVLDTWKSCEKYHLVDVWAQQKNYKDQANVDDAAQDKLFRTTKENLKEYEEKVQIHRMFSTEAAKSFENESIDFIYVDARHDYCGAKEDLEYYWPILKPGGIMAGHDYNENSEIGSQDWGLCGDGSRNELAVKGAVNEFFLPKGLTISVTYYRERNFMSWFVQKPLC